MDSIIIDLLKYSQILDHETINFHVDYLETVKYKLCGVLIIL